MRFFIDGLEVLFPYDYIYPEQREYMAAIKRTLDGSGGSCLLEMPTGTGKTVTLLSFILSYQEAHPDIGKLVYCTRTVQEMDKVLEELERVVEHRRLHREQLRQLELEEAKTKDSSKGKSKSKSKSNTRPPLLGVCLSSRRNMCVHPEVSQFDNRGKVDALCRNRTASFVREEHEGDMEQLCEFYEGYATDGVDTTLTGIYSLDAMRQLGIERKWCPYFAARRLISLAGVVVYNYQYLLDPKIANLVSREIDKNSIVVFDEAHNIDNVCIEALSVTLNRHIVHASRRNAKRLSRKVQQAEQSDARRLHDEYKSLVRGLAQSGAVAHIDEEVLANPVLPDDVLAEAVPGNIRKARNFISFLTMFIEFLAETMRARSSVTKSPKLFVTEFQNANQMTEQARGLKFAHDRLSSLLRTLQITDVDEYSALQTVANFATLVSTYSEGFSVLFEPYNSQAPNIPDPVLELACLDSALAIKPVFERFRNVIITSGTLSPLIMYSKILSVQPKVAESFRMTLSRRCICPMIVSKGADQMPITSKFDRRDDASVVLNYGNLLVEMARIVPDGVVCFFTSYRYMEDIVAKWEKLGILQQVLQHKLLYIETKDIVETTMALDNFKRACDIGRGAVFLSVARGKVAEGIDFDGHYGRCVIMMGVPFQYTRSQVLLLRLAYLREKHQIRDGDYLSFDAMRQASQCMGRVIRSKTDFGIMIFADMRYSRASKLDKLPEWIRNAVDDADKALSTQDAAGRARRFLKEMAQPRRLGEEIGHTMLAEEHLARQDEEETKEREKKQQQQEDMDIECDQ